MNCLYCNLGGRQGKTCSKYYKMYGNFRKKDYFIRKVIYIYKYSTYSIKIPIFQLTNSLKNVKDIYIFL